MRSRILLRISAGLLAFQTVAPSSRPPLHVGALGAQPMLVHAAPSSTPATRDPARSDSTIDGAYDALFRLAAAYLAVLCWQLARLTVDLPTQARPLMLTTFGALVGLTWVSWSHGPGIAACVSSAAGATVGLALISGPSASSPRLAPHW